MAFCKNCGANIPENSKFCPGCGTPVEGVQPYTEAAPGGYRVNIKKRDIAVAVILSVVTCGIYGLIWFYNLVNELNIAAPDQGDSTPGMVLLLSIVTCGIYSLFWIYRAGEKVDRIKRLNGEPEANSALIFLLVSFFGFSIIAYCLIQAELNKVAAFEA